MSEAREAVLARLRRSLGREEGGEAEAAVRTRLETRPIGLVPARTRVTGAELQHLFERQARAVGTHLEQAESMAQVPGLVSRYLRSHNLPTRLVLAPDPWLDEAPWNGQALLTVRRGRALADDAVGLTTAALGVAETGTLVLLSGPQAPTTLAFLPETSIVVLARSRLVGAYEDAFALLRAELDELPRSVNLITGPSRTGDIEQQIQLGAHGPKRLCVVLVGGPPA
jgi:L-lactate dehydrogenase complex protein LldG